METAAVPKDARKTTKAKPKRNKAAPLKVVYISNPMKVTTSASHFRALVQELTGQDAAEWPAAPEKMDAVRVAAAADDHNNNDELGGHEQYHQTPMPAAGGNFVKNIINSGDVQPDDYYRYYYGTDDHGNNHMRPAALEGHAPTTIGDFADYHQMQGGRSSDHSMYFGPSSDVIFGMDGDCYGGRGRRQQQQQQQMMMFESLDSLIDCSSSDANVSDQRFGGGGDAV